MLQIISNYIGVLILGIGEILFAKIVLNQKVQTNKIQTVLILLIATTVFTLGTTYLNGILKSLLLFGIHIFEFKMLFKITYFKSLFLTVIYAIIIVVAEISEIVIARNVIGMTRLFNELAGSILSHLIICIILIIITLFLKKTLRKIVNTEVSNNIKIIILSILTFICIIMFFYIFAREFKIDENAIQYLIVMIVLVAILFSLIKQTIENNRLTQEYDHLLEFMKTYEVEIEKQRILRHETKNEILSIRAKICDKAKNKEILDFIDEILNERIVVKQEAYAKFQHLPANGIKGLCYFKVQEAENKGVKVSLNISPKIKKSTIYDLNNKQRRDFGKILGVFLDNAIEASSESSEKKLGIEAYMTTEKEFKLIISNTFNNEIEKEKIGTERFSTKGKDRGHGLLLVKHIVGMNKIFETKNEITGNIYIQTVIIKEN